MTKISGVNLLNFGSNLYAKREVSDNSEIYITSKLNKLSRQTIADCFVASKLDSLRKFTSRDKSA